MKSVDLSIIILSFNTKNLLRGLLFTIKEGLNFLRKKGFKAEVIVVDNGSWDSSPSMVEKNFKWVKLIKNKKNLGFSFGNNQGAKVALGDYLLFLNSDIKPEKETFLKMLTFLKRKPQFAGGTCKVELENGELDPACHRGFPTPWAAFCYFSGLEKLFPHSKIFSQYHQWWKNFSKIHQINVISGAFFMIKRGIFKKLGGFDENFFMYGEDIDLCLRLRQAGHKIIYYPHTKIIHYKKRSGRARKLGKIKDRTRESFYQTMRLFYEKHYKNRYPWIVRELILLGIKIVSLFKE